MDRSLIASASVRAPLHAIADALHVAKIRGLHTGDGEFEPVVLAMNSIA